MKIIRLSESDLERIVKKVISEQIPGMPSNNISAKEQRDAKLLSDTAKILPCVPTAFKLPIQTLIKENYNKLILKTSLGVIGRESDFGDSKRYKYTAALKFLGASLGFQTSVGLGQMKPETAEKYGLSIEDLAGAIGSLKGVYKLLFDNYSIALKTGYTNQPSTNLPEGTGFACLDIAIAAYNGGQDKIVKYCKTNDPKRLRPCSLVGQTTDEGLKVSNQYVKNYIPNFKTKRWDGVNTSTHGYIKEVASKIKNYDCF